MVTENSNTAHPADYDNIKTESDIVAAPYEANNI